MTRIRVDIDDDILALIDRKAGEEERSRAHQIRFILKGWRGEQPVGWVNQKRYALTLNNTGGRKIQVIKEVRSLTARSLKESKDLVNLADSGQPQVVTHFDNATAAIKARQVFECAGAVVHVDTEGS